MQPVTLLPCHDPATLAAGLQHLRETPPAQRAPILLNTLHNLTHSAPDAGLRLQVLEMLRPVVFECCRALLVANPESDPARLEQEQFQALKLQQQLFSHYQKLQPAAQLDSSSLVLRLQRALHSLDAIHQGCVLNYRRVPKGLWLQMHYLYRLARRHGVRASAVSEPLHTPPANEHIEQLYLSNLLLASARPAYLRASELPRLIELCQSLWPLLRLDSDAAPYRQIAPIEDQPFISIDTTQCSEVFSLSAEKLLEHLQQICETPLVEHLRRCWIEPEPSYQAISIERWQTHLGFEAIRATLGGKPGSYFEIYQGNQPEDIWSSALNVQPASLEEVVTQRDGSIEYLCDTASSDAAPQATTLEMFGQHKQGFQGRLAIACPSVSIGQLLLLRPAGRKDWKLAQVIWLRTEGAERQRCGAQWLEGTPESCEVALLGKQEASPSREGLLLISPSAGQAYLWSPALKLNVAEKVRTKSSQGERLYRVEDVRTDEGTPPCYRLEELLRD